MRLVVAVSARLLVAGAITVTLTMSLDAFIRLALAIACLGLGNIELSRLERGYRACQEIRLQSDGSALILGERDWRAAQLESGSMVFDRLAWLRLRTVDGVLVTELLRGDARRNREWRRLQVIWRHI